MSDKPNNPFRFWQELKRRKVIRFIPVYAAASFVILELVDIIAEPFGLPDWTLKLVVVLLSIGFIISIILTWVYDITPEGVQKTKSVSEKVPDKVPEKPSKIIGWKITTFASAVIIIGLVLFNILNGKRSVDLSDLEKTIAILPFENLGPEDTNSILEHALPIAIMMKLQEVEGFIVRAWSSTRKFKKTEMRSPDIGKELKVNFLLYGYIHVQERDVLVNILLTKATTDDVIWNKSYETGGGDIIRIQKEISKQVASSLKTNFIPGEEILSENNDANMAFLTGLNFYWKDDTKSDFSSSIMYFEKAVKIDPDFNLAYTKLASANSWMYHFYYDRTQDRLNQVLNALEKARTNDPENADLCLAEGTYYYVILDYEKALDLFKKAEGKVYDNVELNICFGALYRRQRKLEKAIEYFRKAVELDPQNRFTIIELAETNLLLRKYNEAEKYFNQYLLLGGNLNDPFFINKIVLYIMWENGTKKSRLALMEAKSLMGNESSLYLTHYQIRIDLIDGKYEDALNTLTKESFDTIANQFIYKPKSLYFAEIYHEQNNIELATAYYDSARIHLETKIAVSPQDSRYHSSLGIAYAGLGRKKEAIEEGLTAVSLMPVEKDFYRGIFRVEDLARIYTMVGEYDLALEQLDQLLSMPSLMSVNLLKKEPVWEPLKNHPDFNRLLETYSEN